MPTCDWLANAASSRSTVSDDCAVPIDPPRSKRRQRRRRAAAGSVEELKVKEQLGGTGDEPTKT
jgi:hypothetical protein